MPADTVKSRFWHGAHIVLVSILAGANIATIILMLATCLSTNLPPATYPKLSQAGLLFPVFLGINILFVLVWLIISWRWAVLPVLGVLLCWGYVRDYCPVNFQSENRTKEGGLLVMSYNVAYLWEDTEQHLDGKQSVDYIADSNADIIFLQECSQSGKMYDMLTHKMDSLRYNTRSWDSFYIFSKWPFVGDMVYRTSDNLYNGSTAWLIDIGGDTTLVINNHLQSTRISKEEKKEYGNAIDSYDRYRIEASGKILLSRLSDAAAERAAQTDSICDIIRKNAGYDIIVAGDHNDTPISYTYQRISSLLTCAFRESGNGLGISFIGRGFPVRIDHIFVSRGLKTSSTYVDTRIQASDHRPILTRVYKSVK
ncbi:MAG: endonuclease/exonuclease/phosphatase family protein [Bacteroidaceae bacterium]|nr:endonuclease/exonuclease/phosphatase family protein [Bacteroidaceae bacterium]